jgi:hypothetical protein
MLQMSTHLLHFALHLAKPSLVKLQPQSLLLLIAKLLQGSAGEAEQQ